MTITTTQAETQQPISSESTSIIRSFQRIVPDYNLINHGDFSAHQHIELAKANGKQIQNIKTLLNDPEMTDLASQKDIIRESSTQTLEVTNLNVISNIKLSQPTLDLIFNHVMSDLQTKLPQIVNTKTRSANMVYETSYKQNPASPAAKEIHHIPQNEAKVKTVEQRQIEEVNKSGHINPDLRLGNKSSKSSKMFVSMCPVLMKTSSADGDSDNDKDSDASSLVDSLEDSVYSESDIQKRENNWKRRNKPTTFFIPIEVSEGSELKSVSEHLPERVRDRLIRRHQLRQQRQMKRRSRQGTNVSEYTYGKRLTLRMKREVERTPKLPELNESRLHTRSVLQNTNTSRKSKTRKETISTHKNHTETSKTSSTKPTCWVVKDRERLPRTISPINTGKSRIGSKDPQKGYNKNESTRRIEIVNIVECSTPMQEIPHHLLQGNSRIPVLISNRQPSVHINIRTPRQEVMSSYKHNVPDSKIDQLIANILINTQVMKGKGTAESYLPHSVRNISSSLSNKRRNSCQSWDMKRDQFTDPIRGHIIRFEDEVTKTNKHFNGSNASTPKVTETSHHCFRYDDSDGSYNDKSENAKKLSSWNTYKGKAAVDVIGDENFLAIPKGWITFYMLHESTGSPCSNSDEGKQDPLSEPDTLKLRPRGINKASGKDPPHQLNTRLSVNKARSHRVKSTEQSTNIGINISSNSAVEYKTILPSLYGEDNLKKSYEHRKVRQSTPNRKDSAQKQNKWHITVSGQHASTACPSDLEMHLRVSEYFNNKDCENAPTSGLTEDCMCDTEQIHFPRIDGKLRNEMPAIHKRMEHGGQKPSSKQLPHISKANHFGYRMT